MPRLPGPEDLGGLPSARSGRGVAQVDTSAIGRGIESFGAGIGQVGEALSVDVERKRREQERNDAFRIQSSFLQFEQAQSQAAVEAAQNVQPGATGFETGIRTGYSESARQFFANVPEHLKPEYDLKLTDLEGRIGSGAATFEREERIRFAGDQIGKGQETLLNRLNGDPSAWAGADADAETQIRNSPLSPVQQQEAIEAWRLRRANALFALDNASDPEGAWGRLGLDGQRPIEGGRHEAATYERASRVQARLMAKGWSPHAAAAMAGQLVQESGVQSSGAVGDAGTAFGLAQWRDDRLADLKAFAADHGKDWTDFDTQVDFIDWELRNTERGAGAALMNAATLEEAAEAAIGYERPQGWTKGNPRGGHGWENRLRAARQIAENSGNPAPQYADIPYEERVKLFEESVAVERTAIEKAATKAEADAKVAYTAYKDAFELSILEGRIFDESTILNDETLNDGDKATLLRSFRTENEKTAQLQGDVALFAGGTLELNPFDSDDTKRADNLYEELAKHVPEDQQSLLTAAVIEQTGIVPKKVAAGLQLGLTSTDPSELAVALADIANIYERAPTSIDSVDGGAALRDASAAFRHLIDDRGLSAEEAAKHIIDSRSEEGQRSEAVMKPLAEKFIKDLTPAEVTNAFDAFFSAEPAAGFNAGLVESMMADYREIAREKFIGEARGDAGVAKAMALAEVKRLYGVTYVSGAAGGTVAGGAGGISYARPRTVATLMKYPPENFYPTVNGSHGYLREAALADARAEAVEGTSPSDVHAAEVSDIYIEATPQTADDLRNGRLPRYRFYFSTKENGQDVWQEVIGAGFGFDRDQLKAFQESERTRRIRDLQDDRAGSRQTLDALEEMEQHPFGSPTVPTYGLGVMDMPEPSMSSERATLPRVE